MAARAVAVLQLFSPDPSLADSLLSMQCTPLLTPIQRELILQLFSVSRDVRGEASLPFPTVREFTLLANCIRPAASSSSSSSFSSSSSSLAAPSSSASSDSLAVGKKTKEPAYTGSVHRMYVSIAETQFVIATAWGHNEIS
eukprot:TRINITY_DN4969_c0_g1_i1.p1 TRINITY_DN4969_c0_g1~~TRINITY_DN4969_c0_g1_i1.p1  ORF type:complete len:141 (-),score=44.67 TRINITY_DN4969_c0_g1_i1:48-470(-)